jgi:arginine decarboxylase
MHNGVVMVFKFPLFIVDQDSGPQGLSDSGVRGLATYLEKAGMEIAWFSFDTMGAYSQQQSQASAFLITCRQNYLDQVIQLIQKIRTKNTEVPIYLLNESRQLENISYEILKDIQGVIHLHEDTPEFVARNIIREAKSYLESVAPPFFNALLKYTEEASYSWHCPGHSGGVAFLKSPVGQMFHQFFGENMLRADVCNAVEQLGQLLDHTGPIAESEKNAAKVFHSDHLFFVTNGTSTSNKIVWHSMVSADDIVVVDRNCHKSVLHAIMMTGATPVYLMPTRNHYGLIGPIPESDFKMENIQKKIDSNPFIKDKSKKPRVLTITQSTYDGIVYNVEMIKSNLDGKIDNLHFDEAWLPHANFHDFYKDMHAIGKNRPRTKHSMIFSTQSTHKLLAGMSQASQILVSEAENKKLNHHIFNESYMMHTSTSPQYSIIASCDVAAAMMKQPGGKALVNESILEAMEFRRTMRGVEKEYAKDWWFNVWGPDHLSDDGIGERDNWILKENEKWHGFGEIKENFNMLDPIKGTVLTPGLNPDGEFGSFGIPASIVAKYLAENGVIVEKCGLYSFFIMFTIGITRGRWQTLIGTLQQFKNDFDKNREISKIMPKFSKANPQYEKVGIKDLCQSIHEEYKKNNVSKMTTEMYISDLQPAMKPSDAFSMMAHEKIERVEINELVGRATAVLLTPYPPGIPLLIPGEKFNKAIVNYLKFAEDFNRKFPGFETDIHGLVSVGAPGEKKYFVDCLKIETKN